MQPTAAAIRPRANPSRPRISASDEVQKLSDADLADAIAKGKGRKMPAFGSKLSSDTIKSLVAYIREITKK